MLKKIIEFIVFAPFVLFFLSIPLMLGGLVGYGLWYISGEALLGKVFSAMLGTWIVITGYYFMFTDLENI